MNDDFLEKCLMRLIKAGIDPFDAYKICKKFEKQDDPQGLIHHIVLIEVLNYDDTREYVD